jgi:hypothetical protein
MSPAALTYTSLDLPLRDVRSTLLSGMNATRLDRPLGIDLAALTSDQRTILSAAITEIQIRSKLWLLENLFRHIDSDCRTILVLGGWCGVLPWLAALSGLDSAQTWISVDRDPAVCEIGRRAFSQKAQRLLFRCGDIFELDYSSFCETRNLVVVNTICEHLGDVGRWRSMLPAGVLVALQSNDYRGCRDHINCVDSAEELVAQAELKQLVFKDSLPLSLFTRFMIIGRA